MSACKWCMTPPDASSTGALVRLLVHSGALPLLVIQMGSQVDFRTHIWLSFTAAAAVSLFAPSYCHLWFEQDDQRATMLSLASSIDKVMHATMTLFPEASPPADALDWASSCWLVMCSLIWGATLLSCALIYFLEARARSMYLLGRCAGWDRRLLARAMREAVVVAVWGFSVMSAVGYATLRMVAEGRAAG
eukprot:evm.model.scf_645.2 EVM.evm.TU.scf_645.2   scf_645:66179-69037(-)